MHRSPSQWDKIAQNIAEVSGVEVSRDADMAGRVSYKAGGKARVFIEPHDADELAASLKAASAHNISIVALGAGSNLLVRDEGFEGLIVGMRRGFTTLVMEGNEIESGAGIMLPRLARDASDVGLGGLTWAVGIPGSVGGAACMNAGTKLGSISRILVTAEIMDLKGNISRIDAKDMGFGYRKSRLRGNNEILLKARLRLSSAESQALNAEMDAIIGERRAKMPLAYPNCGSVFTNPPGESAWRLIADCGLQGKKAGGAEVSRKHANFIVNRGGAKASDIVSLIGTIQSSVYEKTGVRLEPELQIL